jgi:non-ribosomal peptide synthetase component F
MFVKVHHMFAKTVAASPDATALLFNQSKMTYAQLDLLSNQIAHSLLANNVQAGDVVALSFKRSPEMIAAIIAVLKVGAAYLPLDPEYPLERLQYMLDHSKAKLLLHHQELAHVNIAGQKSQCYEELDLKSLSNKAVTADETSDLLYVIYTSGSTGKPKGVALGHEALANLIEWQNTHSIVTPTARTLQFTPISFDVHFQEIFSTLTMGGTLVLIDEQTRLNSLELLNVLNEQNVERLFLPFVALNHLAEVAAEYDIYPVALKEVTTAGEQLKITRHLRKFF